MSRSFRSQKESVIAERAIERDGEGRPLLPRIVERAPAPGDIHPVSKRVLRRLLSGLPVEYLHGLSRIELRARELPLIGQPFGSYWVGERAIVGARKDESALRPLQLFLLQRDGGSGLKLSSLRHGKLGLRLIHQSRKILRAEHAALDQEANQQTQVELELFVFALQSIDEHSGALCNNLQLAHGHFGDNRMKR